MIIYRLAGTQEEDKSIQSDVSITMNDDLSENYFLNKYRIKPICVAVFSVCGDRSLLDFMATSPTYRRYGISTHMLYIVQDILYVCVKN